MKLVFATKNRNKLREVQDIVGQKFSLLSADEIGCKEDIPETKLTIEENALEKALYIYDKYKFNCFADDTALEVEALNGAPGVFSARYAGIEKNDKANVDKILSELEGIENRKAQFRTIVALVIDGKSHLFEGKVEGTVTYEEKGVEGFGYDPIFVPNGSELSFAQMTSEQKNSISHRKRAMQKLSSFLERNF